MEQKKQIEQIFLYSLFFTLLLTVPFVFFSLVSYFNFGHFLMKITFFFVFWFVVIFGIFYVVGKNNFNKKGNNDILQRDDIERQMFNMEEQPMEGIKEEMVAGESDNLSRDDLEERMFDLDLNENSDDDMEDVIRENVIEDNYKEENESLNNFDDNSTSNDSLEHNFDDGNNISNDSLEQENLNIGNANRFNFENSITKKIEGGEINTEDEELKKDVELEKTKKKAIEKKEVTAKLIQQLLKQ